VDHKRNRQVATKVSLYRVGKVFGVNLLISSCCFFLLEQNQLCINVVFLGVQILNQNDLLSRAMILPKEDYATNIRNQVFQIPDFIYLQYIPLLHSSLFVHKYDCFSFFL
jgi:hypothetical protein